MAYRRTQVQDNGTNPVYTFFKERQTQPPQKNATRNISAIHNTAQRQTKESYNQHQNFNQNQARGYRQKYFSKIKCYHPEKLQQASRQTYIPQLNLLAANNDKLYAQREANRERNSRVTLKEEQIYDDQDGPIIDKILDGSETSKKFKFNHAGTSRPNNILRQQVAQKKQRQNQHKEQAGQLDKEPVKTYKQYALKNIEPDKVQPAGLPNIGNTCHLNTIIQFLFGAKQYRQFIVKISKDFQQQTTIKILGDLFALLKSENKLLFHQQYSMKKTCLEQFVRNLQKMNLNYRKYQQEDAFETLNNILNNLDYLHEQQKTIKDMFALDTRIKCRCIPRFVNVSSLFPSLNAQCQECHQKIQKIYLNTPNFIILTGQSIRSSFEIIYCKYKFVSSIIYSGTGRFGHYVCLRKQNGVFYNISDDTVRVIPESQLKRYCFEENSTNRVHSLFSKKFIATLYSRDIKLNPEANQQKNFILKKENMSQQVQSQEIKKRRQFQEWFQKELQKIRGKPGQGWWVEQSNKAFLWNYWDTIKEKKMTLQNFYYDRKYKTRQQQSYNF